MKIGFIGLGNMGGPMARNLAAAGHEVAGFDVTAPTPEGVTKAATAAEVARGADVVITMLPNGQILRAVAAGLGALDAPVSGGVGGAAAGTLTFMVGGWEAAFATVSPLFDIMGQKAVHCGGSGAGQAAKICNNMVLGATMIATCEAFALADKLGLDRQKMFDVVSTSSGYSWSMNAYCPAPGVGPKSPADNGYRPGFASELMLKDLRLGQQAAAGVDADTPMGALAAELMLKDLRLSQQAAEAADADTPMGELAAALYARFVEDEDGKGRDFSAMLPRFTQRHRKS